MPVMICHRGLRCRSVVMTAALALAGCGPVIPPGTPPPPAPHHQPRPAGSTSSSPTVPPARIPRTASAQPGASPAVAAATIGPIAGNAVSAGVIPGPPVATLAPDPANAAAALKAFAASCPGFARRGDASGLTLGADWAAACTAAAQWPAEQAFGFFTSWFETARVANGATFVTGYYEPEIAGVRQKQRHFSIPVYALPPDLVRAKLGEAPALADGRQPLGRYTADGHFVAYYDRGEIEDGALAGRGLEIAWVADPVEFYFLQVQGSGRLVAPDGSVMRIGYAGSNGYDYTNAGALLRAQGLIGTGPGQYAGSMQGIVRYVHDHPDAGRSLLRRNRSYVFFKENPGTDPIAAANVPATARETLAADPAFVPLGAPVWLSVDQPGVSGLWVAQDTGGAIKGPNRFDSFWGHGDTARTVAGGMSARGEALILLPKGTLARLGIK